jgi:protein tyrosine/serine phosphatase
MHVETKVTNGAESWRSVATTGIHNFRDYGGYSVSGGKRLVRRMLYRSGEHARATERDLKVVESIGLSTIIDLRGPAERKKAPCRRPADFSVTVLCADSETASTAPQARTAASINANTAHRIMIERYIGLAFRPLLVPPYRVYFRALAESSGPTLVYCSGGKDRTGLAVALLHFMLGVDYGDLISDYLLTNSSGDNNARVDAIKETLRWSFGPDLSEEAVEVVSAVKAEYLQAAFDSIIDRCGSIDNYITDVLHVTPQMREAIVTRLVV